MQHWREWISRLVTSVLQGYVYIGLLWGFALVAYAYPAIFRKRHGDLKATIFRTRIWRCLRVILPFSVIFAFSHSGRSVRGDEETVLYFMCRSSKKWISELELWNICILSFEAATYPCTDPDKNTVTIVNWNKSEPRLSRIGFNWFHPYSRLREFSYGHEMGKHKPATNKRFRQDDWLNSTCQSYQNALCAIPCVFIILGSVPR